MSAFIVGDETINRVVTHLWADREADYTKRRLDCEVGILKIQQLGEAMFDLNVTAVTQRYASRAAAEEERPLGYRYDAAPVGQMQALKSLKCWLYQCSEGDVPNMPLYQIMQEYANALALAIVRALPEYEAAVWG